MFTKISGNIRFGNSGIRNGIRTYANPGFALKTTANPKIRIFASTVNLGIAGFAI